MWPAPTRRYTASVPDLALQSNECVPLPFEDCPAVNKNARDSNEFFLLIALAAIGGLALIAMAISLMWACCCSGESKEKVDHFIIAGIGLVGWGGWRVAH